MTPAPTDPQRAGERDEALALLRGRFKEPWKLTLRGGGGGRWYAVAQSPGWGDDESLAPGGFVTVDGKGPSPHGAVVSAIAAVDAAFPQSALTEAELLAVVREEHERNVAAIHAKLAALRAQSEAERARMEPVVAAARAVERAAVTDGGVHGRDCIKVFHAPGLTGALHGPNDDGPFDVDGVAYCGRCHGWMGAAPTVTWPAMASERDEPRVTAPEPGQAAIGALVRGMPSSTILGTATWSVRVPQEALAAYCEAAEALHDSACCQIVGIGTLGHYRTMRTALAAALNGRAAPSTTTEGSTPCHE